jgi:small subunit ribosomal protein S16
MAVHIRLARAGTKKVPFYRIVAADQRAPRGGRFIERLGTWDPRAKKLVLDRGRASYWLEHGAVASLTVDKLIKRAQAAPADGATADQASEG